MGVTCPNLDKNKPPPIQMAPSTSGPMRHSAVATDGYYRSQGRDKNDFIGSSHRDFTTIGG
jgi:hypothetical protein